MPYKVNFEEKTGDSEDDQFQIMMSFEYYEEKSDLSVTLGRQNNDIAIDIHVALEGKCSDLGIQIDINIDTEPASLIFKSNDSFETIYDVIYNELFADIFKTNNVILPALENEADLIQDILRDDFSLNQSNLTIPPKHNFFAEIKPEKPKYSYNKKLFDLIKSNDKEDIRQYIKSNTNLNLAHQRDSMGNTVVHWAFSNNRMNIGYELLFKTQLPLSEKNIAGESIVETPLKISVQKMLKEIAFCESKPAEAKITQYKPIAPALPPDLGSFRPKKKFMIKNHRCDVVLSHGAHHEYLCITFDCDDEETRVELQQFFNIFIAIFISSEYFSPFSGLPPKFHCGDTAVNLPVVRKKAYHFFNEMQTQYIFEQYINKVSYEIFLFAISNDFEKERVQSHQFNYLKNRTILEVLNPFRSNSVMCGAIDYLNKIYPAEISRNLVKLVVSNIDEAITILKKDKNRNLLDTIKKMQQDYFVMLEELSNYVLDIENRISYLYKDSLDFLGKDRKQLLNYYMNLQKLSKPYHQKINEPLLGEIFGFWCRDRDNDNFINRFQHITVADNTNTYISAPKPEKMHKEINQVQRRAAEYFQFGLFWNCFEKYCTDVVTKCAALDPESQLYMFYATIQSGKNLSSLFTSWRDIEFRIILNSFEQEFNKANIKIPHDNEKMDINQCELRSRLTQYFYEIYPPTLLIFSRKKFGNSESMILLCKLLIREMYLMGCGDIEMELPLSFVRFEPDTSSDEVCLKIRLPIRKDKIYNFLNSTECCNVLARYRISPIAIASDLEVSVSNQAIEKSGLTGLGDEEIDARDLRDCYCPITCDLMRTPVYLAKEDGKKIDEKQSAYEYDALIKFLKTQAISAMDTAKEDKIELFDAQARDKKSVVSKDNSAKTLIYRDPVLRIDLPSGFRIIPALDIVKKIKAKCAAALEEISPSSHVTRKSLKM